MIQKDLTTEAAKAQTGAGPNPITVACAHAGYEAVRAIKQFMGRSDDYSEVPFDKLKTTDRGDAISDAWDVMQGQSPQFLYCKYDHGGVLWDAADPVVQMQWVLFAQAVATQMKATFALAQAAKTALEG